MTFWWKEVWCPYCGQPPGESCITATGHRTYAHADRLREGEYYVLNEFGEYDEDEDYAEDYRVTAYVPRPMITVYLPGDAPDVPRDPDSIHPSRWLPSAAGAGADLA